IDCQLREATSRRQVMFHDHELMIGWNYMRASERLDWKQKVEDGLVVALERRFGPLPRPGGRVVSVHVGIGGDRLHLSNRARGIDGAKPYMLEDVESGISLPGRRNWTNQDTPPPELPDRGGGICRVPLGVAVVEGERWRA